MSLSLLTIVLLCFFKVQMYCLAAICSMMVTCLTLIFFHCKREIGTIIRSLGCFPSEAELHDIIAEVSGLFLQSWTLVHLDIDSCKLCRLVVMMCDCFHS